MVYVFLGDGFEEAEAICPVDILRRCGVDVKTVSVMDDLLVKGAHNITVKADIMINEIVHNADMYILPGGTAGVENLSKCQKLCKILSSTQAEIAAICAAPTLLARLGLLKGKNAICYPSLTDELIGANVTHERVVTDGRITTSMGPGTSFDFGFTIAMKFADRTVVEQVRAGMLLK